MRSVYPIGTTVYEPESCSNGYNLISDTGVVKLVDMNGVVAHRWSVDPTGEKGFIHRARLLESGVMMLLFGPGDVAGHVAEFDWEGNETWSYEPERYAHHDFWPTEQGSVLLICEIRLPAAYLERIQDPVRKELEVFGDELIEVSRDGEIVWRWVQHEHIDVNICNPIPASRDWGKGENTNTITDWTHTNTIQALPENKWFDSGDTRFKPGNVLESMRQLDTINIIDRETGKITWSYTGDYRGGLSGQHEPHMIEKGLPGAGNIIVFDNGASPQHDLAHCGCSYVLEIDPSEDRLVWVYDADHFFFSRFTANCQRLPNGNTLIFEAMCRRMFEVTPERNIVWEHVLTENAQRVYRYPYDFTEAFKTLPSPAERRVSPPEPETLQVEPDG